MALADFIKACSLSESPLKTSSTSTTTSQVVGLLSVLAISGSVALLSLAGKLKLTGPSDSSVPSELDGPDGLITSEDAASEPSRMDGRDCVKACSKRVRFADDVVEPRGNSHEYRLRFAQRQHEECVGRSIKRQQQPCNSIPANRMALYKGLRQHRLQHSVSFFS